jgi:hypothetical protein
MAAFPRLPMNQPLTFDARKLIGPEPNYTILLKRGCLQYCKRLHLTVGGATLCVNMTDRCYILLFHHNIMEI